MFIPGSALLNDVRLPSKIQRNLSLGNLHPRVRCVNSPGDVSERHNLLEHR